LARAQASSYRRPGALMLISENGHMVGSLSRRNQLLSDLLDLGLTINSGFFAPAGLDLGAETPEEIAFAIVSEIQPLFAGASGESLRGRKRSIHGPIGSAVLA
jgi:xanthine/CO dehydrogenase XdhC/CoxF family maturation factor